MILPLALDNKREAATKKKLPLLMKHRPSQNTSGPTRTQRVVIVYLTCVSAIGCATKSADLKQAIKAPDDPALQRLKDHQSKFASLRGQNIYSGYQGEDLVAAAANARIDELAPDISKEELAELRAEVIRDLRRELPTQFENPLTHGLLRDSAQRIQFAAQEMQLPEKKPPIFGTLPLTSLNAEALPRGPADEVDVVVLNDALVHFLAVGASVAAMGLPDKDKDLPVVNLDVNEWAWNRLKQNPDGIRQMALLVYGLISDGKAYPDKKKLTAFQSLYGHLLGEGMRDFVVAHEYAHVYLGHTVVERGSLKLSIGDGGDVTVDYIGRGWKREMEADGLAARLLHASASSKNPEYNVRISPAAYRFSGLLYHRLSMIADEGYYLRARRQLPPTIYEDVEERVEAHLTDPSQSPIPFHMVESLYFGTVSHPPSWVRQRHAIREGLSRLDKAGDILELRDMQIVQVMDAWLNLSWEAAKPVVLAWLRESESKPINSP